MPWHLIGANLRAHWVRSLLTMGSLAVAVFLLCFLQTVVVSLEAGINASSSKRLIVQSAVSLFVDLPLAYQGKIEGVPGVARTTKQQWFGAYYQEPSNFFPQFGVDHDKFLDAYPEIQLVEGSREAFAASPTACLIGVDLANRFGWKVGDRIPLIGTIFPRADGNAWEFQVAGIYRSTASNVDQGTVWFRFDYLRQSIEQGAVSGFTETGVGVFVIDLADRADPVRVAAAVDELFANGPQRTQTTSEAEFQRQFVTMLGSIPVFLRSIGGAILFAILLAVVNTMLMSARQRTHELGVLKALGFTDSVTFTLLMAESMLLSLLGGGLGLGISLWTAPGIKEGMATMFPNFELTPETMTMAAGATVVVGLLAGLLPALRASRLDPVEALRAEV